MRNILENLEQHKKRSVQTYSQGHRSDTKGLSTKLHYHADRLLSDVEKQQFDEILESWDRDIFTRYISRYRISQGH